MKTALAVLSFCAALSAYGQGTSLLYDQQSSTDETPYPYGSGSTVQTLFSPWGQSFTPTLSGIDFIKLSLVDGNTVDTAGATFDVRLHSGSLSGPVIGTTASVSMPNGFSGVSIFQFSSTISLTPGTTYFFEPLLVSGGTWNIISGSFSYTGGSAYDGGAAWPGSDIWFREGIVVPEPTCIGLAFLGGLLFLARKAKGRTSLGSSPLSSETKFS